MGTSSKGATSTRPRKYLHHKINSKPKNRDTFRNVKYAGDIPVSSAKPHVRQKYSPKLRTPPKRKLISLADPHDGIRINVPGVGDCTYTGD